MAKGKRNYPREYARRKRNALARGFTTAQARGHARSKIGEAPVSELRDAEKERIQATALRLTKAQQLMDAGVTQSKALKEAGTSARTYKKYHVQYKFEDGVSSSGLSRSTREGAVLSKTNPSTPPTLSSSANTWRTSSGLGATRITTAFSTSRAASSTT